MEPSELDGLSDTIGIDLEGLRQKYANKGSASHHVVDSEADIFDTMQKAARAEKIKHANDTLDKYKTCHVCQGTGLMKSVYNFMTLESNCDHCEGEGVIIKSVKGENDVEIEAVEEEAAEDEVNDEKEDGIVIEKVLVLCGGNLASDIGEKILEKMSGGKVEVEQKGMWEVKGKSLTDGTVSATTLVVFIIETVENEMPPEEASTLMMFFKRKSHPEDLLSDKFKFCVLGLGNSDLLLDRQTTTAKDCNQAAQTLDKRLEALGGSRHFDLCIADERSELVEVEPWLEHLVESLQIKGIAV